MKTEKKASGPLDKLASIPSDETVSLSKIENDDIWNALQQATEAMDEAFNPWSDFSVGAAIVQEGEKIATGANRELADFDQATCSERITLHRVTYEVLNPNQHLILGIISKKPDNRVNPKIATPCGRCRQELAEAAHRLKTDIKIAMSNTLRDKVFIKPISELFPLPLNEETKKDGIVIPSEMSRTINDLLPPTEKALRSAKKEAQLAYEYWTQKHIKKLRSKHPKAPINFERLVKERIEEEKLVPPDFTGAAILTAEDKIASGFLTKYTAPIVNSAIDAAFNNLQKIKPTKIKKVKAVILCTRSEQKGKVLPIKGQDRQKIFEQSLLAKTNSRILLSSFNLENILETRISDFLPYAFGRHQM